MTATAAYAPLTPEEAAAANDASHGEVPKVPIVPVPEDAPPFNFKIPSLGGAPTMKWAYLDADGKLLGYDARFDYEDAGKPAKQVLPVSFCEIGDKRSWRAKAMPAPRSLYGLDKLAARPDAPVVIVEGCKTADAAAELLTAYVAVSWQGGGGAVHLSDWSALADRDVLIWPDRDRHKDAGGEEKPYDDQAGTLAAVTIANRVGPIAKSLSVLCLDELDVKDGWDAADAVDEGWTPDDVDRFLETYARDRNELQTTITMPAGYEYGNDACLWYVEPGKAGGIRIAGGLKVVARTRDQDGASWGILLEWNDDDQRAHQLPMPRSWLASDGSTIWQTLMDGGLYVNTDPKARRLLAEFLARVDHTGRARAVSKVGWSGDVFVLPEQTIGDRAGERVLFQSGEAQRHPYQMAGTLDRWKADVAAKAVGNSRLTFGLSAAFVGPLLGPCGEESAVINFIGPSSIGKTTKLALLASVWGEPKTYIRQWRATSNGLEGVALQHSETLLCLDELGQLEPREAGQVAYMIANEQGKTRANRLGNSRAVASWKVCAVSSGEIGLADLVREGSARSGAKKSTAAGQEIRVLDVPADAGAGLGVFEHIHDGGTPEAFSRQLKDAARKTYGLAGPAFLRILVTDRAVFAEAVLAAIRQFVDANVTDAMDGQVQRAARRFGLIGAAGELAASFGVLPWPEGEAMGSAAIMFRAWLDRRGTSGSAEERNMIAAVRSFLEMHGSSRFASMVGDEDDRVKVINRAGFWRYEDGGREFLILTSTFKEEICAGFDAKAVSRVLIARGLLRPDVAGKKSAQSVTLPGMGKTRVFVIAPEIFDAE